MAHSGQMTEVRDQKSEIRSQMTDFRHQLTENRRQSSEFGSRTRRRPIGLDYGAAKDAEVGKKEDR
jgi:hypothetical protein